MAGGGRRAVRLMFEEVDETWNPVTGCTHGCSYCWARRLVETRLRGTRKYRRGFSPTFHERELERRFRPGTLVFVCDMGDLFCSGVPDSWIRRVIERAAMFPATTFLFLTKNPERYRDFEFPPNAVLGATVETDRDDVAARLSRAPPPTERLRALAGLRWPRKLVSVEPVLDFTPRFADAILSAGPAVAYIGYDNHGCRLPEPPLHRVLELAERLERGGVEVRRKTIRPAWYEG